MLSLFARSGAATPARETRTENASHLRVVEGDDSGDTDGSGGVEWYSRQLRQHSSRRRKGEKRRLETGSERQFVLVP
eukprot:1142419-Prymnesium_polylepis.1